MTYKINILSGVQLIWIQRFPSPRPVVMLRLKIAVCSTIGSYLKEEYLDSYVFSRVMWNENRLIENLNSTCTTTLQESLWILKTQWQSRTMLKASWYTFSFISDLKSLQIELKFPAGAVGYSDYPTAEE